MAGKRPDGKVFASGASDGEVLDFPSIERGWGVTLDGKDPDGNSVTDATDGIPPMEWDNALQQRIDSNILWLLQNALPEWATGTWPVKSVVVNNDIVYRAVKETAVEPTASAGDWTALFPLVSLDGRYAQVSKNLSDLSDGAKAKENLALDKVGNWVAVQQGGGTGMESNKVYVGWDGSKLILQVDSSPEGEMYYKNNQPPYPVTSVNNKTGAVSLGSSDVGLGNVGNYAAVQANGGLYNVGPHSIHIDWGNDGKLHITVDNTDQGAMYTTKNPPPYPVTSVNGKTGAVALADGFSVTYPAMLWNSGLSGFQMRSGDFAVGVGAGATTQITFPAAFGGGCLMVIPVPDGGSAEEQLGVTDMTATGAILHKGAQDSAARGGKYLAIGYDA